MNLKINGELMKLLLALFVVAAPSFAAQMQKAQSMPQLSTMYSGNEIHVVKFEFESSRSQTPVEWMDFSDSDNENQIELQIKLKNAIGAGDRKDIENLIKAGADQTAYPIYVVLRKQFLIAVKNGDEEAKKYWVSLGADPIETDGRSDSDDCNGVLDLP